MTTPSDLRLAEQASEAASQALYNLNLTQRMALNDMLLQGMSVLRSRLSEDQYRLLDIERLNELTAKAVGLAMDTLLMNAADDAGDAARAVTDLEIEAEESAHAARADVLEQLEAAE